MKRLILLRVLCACALCGSLLAQDRFNSSIGPDTSSAPAENGPVISQDNSGWQPGDNDNPPVVGDGGGELIPGMQGPINITGDPDLTSSIVQQGIPGNNAFPFIEGGYELYHGDQKWIETMVFGTMGNIAAWGAAQGFVAVAGGSFFLPEVIIGGAVAWGTEGLLHWIAHPELDGKGAANDVGHLNPNGVPQPTHAVSIHPGAHHCADGH